ncbi:MAG TPA: hypothetical protein VEM96_13440 [Pyrinomonadaceae bacterium]|nr:hypothetical protein [Pyrinomonadaceae bacterium]
MKINFGRVLLGGLVAGVILNIGEYILNDKVLGAQMKEYFAKHNFPTPGGNAIAVAVVMTFVLGIVIVLGYAAIRPRFGAGPKTAIIAALFAWFGVYVYPDVVGAAFGFVPTSILPIALVWGLVEYNVAALIGAWLYKEA